MSRSSRRRPGELNDKPVYLATPSGQYPTDPKPAVVILREWSEKEVYWTLDVNGDRFIVKWFAGGPKGGAIYRAWQSCQEQFSGLPIAFSAKKVSVSRDKQRSTRDKEASAENTRHKQATDVSNSFKATTTSREKHDDRLSHEPSHNIPYISHHYEKPRLSNSAKRRSNVEQSSTGHARTTRSANETVETNPSRTQETSTSQPKSEDRPAADHVDKETSTLSSKTPANRTRSKKRRR